MKKVFAAMLLLATATLFGCDHREPSSEIATGIFISDRAIGYRFLLRSNRVLYRKADERWSVRLLGGLVICWSFR